MKKPNMLCSLVVLCLLFAGCDKNNTSDYTELLLDTWVNTRVDEQPVLTDEACSIEFKSDNTALHAIGLEHD